MSELFVYPKRGDFFRFPLKKEKVLIGRAEDNAIPIRDPFSSGHHSIIFFKEDRYFIRDNNSKNGTYLNSKKIKAETELNKGDEILIGSTRIVFDKELSTNVEVTDAPSSSSFVNTIMNIEEVLKKPEIDTTIQAAKSPFDLDKLKAEHQAYSILSEVSKSLVLHMQENELLEHIMDLICENLPMDRGTLMLKEGNPPQFISKVVRINNEKLKDQRMQVSQTIIQMAVDKHSAVMTSDAQADPRFKAQESVIKLNIHSALCVPLWNNKEIIGIIYADRISLLDQFSDDELRLLTLLSNLAAVKIENARNTQKMIDYQKVQQELSLAAKIQKDFLPKENPHLEKTEIAGSNYPCYQVGGDYYDFIKIDENRIGVVIADVSGKGVGASLLMASLRAALHSEVHPNYDLNKMVVKLNNFVHSSTEINSFITFFYCDLDQKSGELSCINSGHNPPLLIDKKKKIRRLESSGLCLGMFPDAQYKTEKVKLNPGDTLVLYTDGITESRNAKNEEFMEKGVIEVCQKLLNKPPLEIMDRLYEKVQTFTAGQEQMDDMTIVIIQRAA
jgi:serine phosphatase RsbU (regulator of sigma subunit)